MGAGMPGEQRGISLQNTWYAGVWGRRIWKCMWDQVEESLDGKHLNFPQ